MRRGEAEGRTPDFIRTIVTSTRVRLARNLEAYPFPKRLSRKDGKEIVEIVEHELKRQGRFDKFVMDDLEERNAVWLQEQHLISPALRKNKELGAAFISRDKEVSVMVNEEDHLREQYISMGFDLLKTYERISAIDENIGANVNFACDKRFGYLTACPSNLGTGMRASVMMFLPGIARNDAWEEALPLLKEEGRTVRGVFGEGSNAEGYSYQVSNERTLGISEGDILRKVSKVTMAICDLELREREKILSREKIPLKDGCLRAYGTITNCAVLPLQELTEGIVKVKLGMALGFLSAEDIKGFNNFLANMRPASFRIENELEDVSEYECDLARAEIVRKVFPELVRRTDG